MHLERFQRAEQVFHDALAMTPVSRAQYIAEAARGDQEFASRVQRMIGFAERTSPTADLIIDHNAPAHDRDASARLVGAIVGRYRIAGVIGEGGFGTVYRAEQLHPVQRPVALKVLKGGMDSRQVIARFDAERQALALMEHPNIARVFDAGQTEPEHGSRPYFVMELVGGEPISVFCDRHRLDWKARLELFIAVCHAVQHAHQKGIIHRDLKPSNILVSEVDGTATPKIIDFGIAKAIDQPLTDGMLVTRRLELLGTPQYMSPEQADLDGRAIDTRTDMYSLGAVLYELMTGSTPLAARLLRDASFTRIQHLIREQAVERPSTRLIRLGGAARDIAQHQATDVAALRRRLRGDLDWIMLKALDPERERRYASASTFADDLRRYLRHEPVLARAPSAAYRVRKFIRRHRVGTIAAALIALAIVGGATATTIGMLRARDAAAQALAVNAFMREVLTSPNPERHGADVRLVTVLDEASRRASIQFAGYPRLESEVRELIGMVRAKSSQNEEALKELRQALALRQQEYHTDHPVVLQTEIQVANALAALQRASELESLVNDLLPRVRRVLGERHESAATVERLAARAAMLRGRQPEAEQSMRAAFGWVNEEFSADSLVRLEIMDGLIDTLYRRLHRDITPEERKRTLDEVFALAREVRDRRVRLEGPQSLSALRAQVKLAKLADQRGKPATVMEICESILSQSQSMLADCHDIRMDATALLASALRLRGQVDAAADLRLRNVACLRTLHGEDEVILLAAQMDTLPFLDFAGRWSEGEALARSLQTKFHRYGAKFRELTFGPDIYLARFCVRQGRLEEAAPILEQWLRAEQSLEAGHNRARLHLFHGAYLAARRQFAAAEREILAAAAITGEVRIGTWVDHPDDILLELIALYDAWAQPEKAEEYRQMHAEMIRAANEPDSE